MKNWTPQETAFLIRDYLDGISARNLCLLHNRSARSVNAKIRWLGLDHIMPLCMVTGNTRSTKENRR